jgi:FtsP/CotA-like multicopper oxidase with cupredoxin domain
LVADAAVNTTTTRGKAMTHTGRGFIALTISLLFAAFSANAQDSAIYVQCPDTDADGNPGPSSDAAGVKCMHISGGDGFVTMADGERLYVFSFADIEWPRYQGGDPVPEHANYSSFTMQQGMLAAEAPAPTIAIDEGDELYLTLTNVGMTMRPDLFDPHTVHWHGFPQAASVFDGVPDASIAVNMGASLTYYYKAMDPGTYMYHCHVEATEHMQMGMLGNLYVRPAQNSLPAQDLNGFAHVPWDEETQTGNRYAYNDGDGSTAYDVEYPIQLGSFDKAFHDASENVQPLPFSGMRDTYFLINGRGYPDTVNSGIITTTDALENDHEAQPVSSLITAQQGQRILLRVSNLNVTQFNTIGTNGPAMQVVARDARLLRDDDGNDMYYMTNSLTLGGGQSADVIIDTNGLQAGQTFFLYSTNLDYLANHYENFGGMMTEIRITN